MSSFKIRIFLFVILIQHLGDSAQARDYDSYTARGSQSQPAMHKCPAWDQISIFSMETPLGEIAAVAAA